MAGSICTCCARDSVTPNESAAALMDRIYRPQRWIYDFTRKHYLLGRDDLIDALTPAPGDRVLEIGCGTARNLIIAARRHPHARFYGVDLSAAMLEAAHRSVTRAGLFNRIRLARADATGFDPDATLGAGAFERVMMSYCLSMIPDWRRALGKAVAVTAPGGALHVVDFGMLEGLPSWCRAMLHAWLAGFHVTPSAELEREMRRLAAETGAELRFERLFGGYAQGAVLRRPARSPAGDSTGRPSPAGRLL